MSKLAIYLDGKENQENLYDLLGDFSKVECDEKLLFFNNQLEHSKHIIPSFHSSNLYYFDGPAIATCMATAFFLSNCPTVPAKYLYIREKFWESDRWMHWRNEGIFANVEVFSTAELAPQITKQINKNCGIYDGIDTLNWIIGEEYDG